MVLEEPPVVADVVDDELPGPLPFVLSARDEDRLPLLAARLADHVAAGDTPLPALAAALAHGRAALESRAVVLAADRDELAAKLRGLDAVRGTAGPGSGTVFVFPGQGGHWVGMGRELMDESPEFLAWVRHCDSLLLAHGCDWTLEEALGGSDDLARVDVVQPASFVMMTGLAQLWAAAGVVPDVVLGSSQGEIAAACVAGLLTVEDALRAIVLRSRMAAALPATGGMLVVGVGRDRMTELLTGYEGRLEIAAVNGPAMVAVSGVREAIEEFAGKAAELRLWFRRIKADYASHSFLGDVLEEPMLSGLAGIGTRPPHGLVPGCRFYSTVDGGVVPDDERLDAGYWFRNMRRPVELDAAVRAVSADARAIVEVSPHPGLAPSIVDIVQDAGRSTAVLATLRRGEGGRARLTEAFAEAFAAGVTLDWAAVLPGRSSWRAACAQLPTYPFAHRRYWLRGTTAAGTSSLGVIDPGHPLLAGVVELPDGEGVMGVARLGAGERLWPAGDVPDAALVELAVRTGDEVDCGNLDRLDVLAPLRLAAGPVRVQVRVGRAGADGRRPVLVRSAPVDEAQPVWTGHARGVLAPTETGADFGGVAVWPPAGAQPVGSGPGGVTVWRRGEEVFAYVTVTADQREAAGRFLVHPVLLSSALEAAGIAGTSSWQGFVVHAAGAAQLRVRVWPSADGFAVQATDESGLPVFSASRVLTRQGVDRAVVRSGALRVEWVPLGVAGSGTEVVAVRGDEDVLRLNDQVVPVVCAVPLGEDVVSACCRVLTLAQTWLDEPHLAGRLVVRTTGAVQTRADGSTTADPASSAVWEMVSAIQVEHPGRFVLLDAPDHAAVAGVLEAGVPQAVVRDGQVHVPKLVPTGEPRRSLDQDGAVLVIGGTGVAGGRVARHLVAEHGVRHLVLVGRSGTGAPDLLGDLAAAGAKTSVIACDVTDREALRQLLQGIDHPLTAVVHAAGVPDDSRLAELDPDRLAEVLTARAESLRHVADLAAAPLLVVTSAGALTGHHPAVAAADGYARAALAGYRTASAPVLVPGEDDVALSAVSAAITTGEPFPLPARPDLWAEPAAGRAVPALLRGLVRTRRRQARQTEETVSTGRWADLLIGRSAREREEVVLDLVRTQLAEVLGLDGPVHAQRGFFELGLDSLMAIELSRRIRSHTGATLTPAGVFGNPTPAALTEYLLAGIDGEG